MDWFYALPLLRLFDFYLALAFLLSVAVRVQQYRTVLQVVWAVPSRWPRLFALVRHHRRIFLTWGVAGPLLLSLGLFLAHTLLRRWVLEGSIGLTVGDLLSVWPAVPFVVVSGLAMLACDGYGALQIGHIDRAEAEKYFDQAEFWLSSWTSPVVRIFTFGYINPRKIVHTEVEKALISVSEMFSSSLRYTAIQAGLRILFGLSLWVTYAVS